MNASLLVCHCLFAQMDRFDATSPGSLANGSLCHCLFAQMDRFEGLRDRFSGPRARFGMEEALTAIGAMAAVAAVLYLINRWHNRFSGRQSYNSPKEMFRELCRAHGLNRQSRQLLLRVARWQRLTHPARLFLEPERFEPANLSAELERHSAELFELRDKLFTFEVEPESRDSMVHEPEIAAVSASRSVSSAATPAQPVAENATATDARTEAIGAAAFASTRLGSTAVDS